MQVNVTLDSLTEREYKVNVESLSAFGESRMGAILHHRMFLRPSTPSSTSVNIVIILMSVAAAIVLLLVITCG